MMDRTVEHYEDLTELDRSALVEVGNIMISTFINALSGLAEITTHLTVPAFAVDMQGRNFGGAHGGVRRTVGLYHDHWGGLFVQRAEGALPAAALPGYPLSEFSFEEAGCVGWIRSWWWESRI
ncbi:MAG: chemotaxis protein CheC [Dysosmobacter sp.]